MLDINKICQDLNPGIQFVLVSDVFCYSTTLTIITLLRHQLNMAVVQTVMQT